MSEATIRPERPGDENAVGTVVAAAFGRDAEARLVALIRERGESRLSLVAEIHGEIVGHVLASPIRLTPPQAHRYLGIAPLSVAPEYQGQGIGGALMRAVIAAARIECIDALFLLGRPAYYTHFGFVRSHIGNVYGATDAFMHLELTASCLSNIGGTAHYVAAFGDVGA